MSISTDFEIYNIRKLAELLKKKYELKNELSQLLDEEINISIHMTTEDIIKANKLFEKMMEE